MARNILLNIGVTFSLMPDKTFLKSYRKWKLYFHACMEQRILPLAGGTDGAKIVFQQCAMGEI